MQGCFVEKQGFFRVPLTFSLSRAHTHPHKEHCRNLVMRLDQNYSGNTGLISENIGLFLLIYRALWRSHPPSLLHALTHTRSLTTMHKSLHACVPHYAGKTGLFCGNTGLFCNPTHPLVLICCYTLFHTALRKPSDAPAPQLHWR